LLEYLYSRKGLASADSCLLFLFARIEEKKGALSLTSSKIIIIYPLKNLF